MPYRTVWVMLEDLRRATSGRMDSFCNCLSCSTSNLSMAQHRCQECHQACSMLCQKSSPPTQDDLFKLTGTSSDSSLLDLRSLPPSVHTTESDVSQQFLLDTLPSLEDSSFSSLNSQLRDKVVILESRYEPWNFQPVT